MAIVTLEDLQGTIEVVVFPRLYEQTTSTWRDGEILLVAGRVDHKGEEVSLLADLAVDWDAAAAAGAEAFARQVAAGERGGGGAARAPAANGNGYGHGTGNGGRGRRATPRPGRAGPGAAGRRAAPAAPAGSARHVHPVRVATARRRQSRAVPARPRLGCPRSRRPTPVSTYPETPGVAIGPDQDDEPPVPDEARARIVADATADDAIDAGPETVLHVRFAGNAAPDRVVGAMETFKAVMRDRPGATRVVIYVPATGGGSPLPMELRRGVAYDAELLAEVRRQLGDGLVELRLGVTRALARRRR